MLSEKIYQFFNKNDKVIFQLLQLYAVEPLSQRFTADQFLYRLATDIIGQQLSVKVADVITKRFDALFKDEITPEKVLAIADQTYRDIGMSWAKIKYVKDLAQKVEKKQINLDMLTELADEQVVEELIKVKGIGRWTAEMFLIFTLGREDVFSFGDLGLKRAIEKNYHFEKDTPQKQWEHLIENWKPYRSYAALSLWRSLDNKPNM